MNKHIFSDLESKLFKSDKYDMDGNDFVGNLTKKEMEELDALLEEEDESFFDYPSRGKR